MDWQIALALVVIIPVILLPVAFVWFLNFGVFASVMKRVRARRAISEKAEARAD